MEMPDCCTKIEGKLIASLCPGFQYNDPLRGVEAPKAAQEYPAPVKRLFHK